MNTYLEMFHIQWPLKNLDMETKTLFAKISSLSSSYTMYIRAFIILFYLRSELSG